MSYFRDKSHFVDDDGNQNYSIFQPIDRYFKRVIGAISGEYTYFWKSKGLSDERINSIAVSNHIITPELSYFGNKIRVKLGGSCLKLDEITHTLGEIVNIYIVHEINKNYNISCHSTLENCLFGTVSLSKNADIDKYKYSGCGIGFVRKEKFSVGNGFGKIV